MAIYVGGPCDGLGVGNQTGATLVCAGVSYSLGSDGDYHVTTDAGGAIGTAALGTHAPKGWHDLQVSVNRRLPTALTRSRRIRMSVRRTIARRRRR